MLVSYYFMIAAVVFRIAALWPTAFTKPFLDAVVYRGGDVASGWIYAGLTAIGLSIGAIALVAAPVAAIWALLGIGLGRRQEVLAQQAAASVTAPAEGVAEPSTHP